MTGRMRKLVAYSAGLAVPMVFAVLVDMAPAQPEAQPGGCTPDERRQALRAMQAEVMQGAPRDLDSLEKAVQPGGPLGGWRLSHGLVVLASAGAVGIDNIEAKAPMPPLLLYAPSAESAPEDWLDFDGPDGPYRLVGWSYIVPYKAGSAPPSRRCIAGSEWWIHEAGWHLMDGGMHLTPDATSEPPGPELAVGTYFWHPRVWVLHAWVGRDGVPTISFANPAARGGGLELPEDTFYRLVNGRKQRPAAR